MLRKILGVGGLTLVSRVTGFARDVVLAATLGAGPMADAFVVAMRIPNHFRAIFGEGAFNAAFVPTYAAAREQGGPARARSFGNAVFTLLLASQIIILGLALVFMPAIVGLLAPGLTADPARFDLAVALTRITFPYLLFITLVTLHAGALNSVDHYMAGAAAPILLNLSMIAALAAAFLFPSAAHAAAWGVALAGVLELGLLTLAVQRGGVLSGLARPALTDDVRRFFRTLGPAVIGSGSVQIAMFADTILASLLPAGAMASIYYADRLYQLPIGVVGVAAGTVLLAQASRMIAAGRTDEALHAQNRAAGLTLALSAPFAVAFLMIPEAIVMALFGRGAFSQEAASGAGAVLAAYAVGLPAIVLIRSAVTPFQARGDTRTPMLIAFAAVAVNVALKILLTQRYGAPGLAFATSAGAWVNLALLIFVGARRRVIRLDGLLLRSFAAAFAASLALAATIWLTWPAVGVQTAHLAVFRQEIALAAIGLIGLGVYAASYLVAAKLFKAAWR